MKLTVVLFVIASFAASATGFAQTCASPIALATTPLVVSGTTCAGTTQLPTLVNGAIAGTQQIVHRVTVGTPVSGFAVTVQPEAGFDVATFVCPNQCSPTASCVAAVDSNGAGGSETAQIPGTPGDYYIIVQSVNTCGSYSLVLTAPLSD